ncbi:ASKHA domain-containing protein [Methanolacinia paynteri]|uniref:ASKHA domain-containing protein n=1 Tax=Methanolacinia paynteri TaxID=230356 RepID=UPI00064E9D81|nr:ASKHA domain-containing protein [Methanolacinia paynteri]
MSEKDHDVRVTFEPDGKTIEDSSGTLLELAQAANTSLRGDCGGAGVCGKCRVQIVKLYGKVSEPTEKERDHLKDEEIAAGYRLACQTKILTGKCTVHIPPASRTAKREISGLGLDEDVPLGPAARKIHLKPERATFGDPRPDIQRLKDSLQTGDELNFPLSVLSELPAVLRSSGWNITATLWKDKLVSVEPEDTSKECFGIGVDIGSSKIICHLVDLLTGETIAKANGENPQIMYGEDVVSRITYASKSPEKLKKLQSLATGTINSLIDEACKESGKSPENIYEMVFVGNSVMHHLVLGIIPKYIGVAPFVPAVTGMVSFPAKDIGININPDGMVTAIPLIGGFIGADAVANILISGIYETEDLCLLIDIGTNSEILLGNSKEIMACSAPSGPSFEGAHISSGMKAVSGAIESVKIIDGKLLYSTIDDEKPRGICGSGIIDLVAELYTAGIITRTGKFTDLSHPRIVVRDVPRFIVAGKEESGIDNDISVSEKDINEFLLAKGSLKAGWKILADKWGVAPSEIDRIYLAGSFGTHVNIDNAIVIDILPDIDREKIVFAGETAVGGAKIALKSLEKRNELKEILKRVRYVELSVEDSFQKDYLASIPISGLKS